MTRFRVVRTTSGSAFDHIPDEMKTLNQWGVWRYSQRANGKATKPPYDHRTGRMARVDVLSDWGKFEDAVNAFQNSKYQGIGFLFTNTDRLVGVDIDDCINSKTGKPYRWAQDIIDGLPTYWEFSPSETGLHGIMIANKPPKGLKTAIEAGKVEVYGSGRYFTVTGKHLSGTKLSIANCTQRLRGLTDRLFTASDSAVSVESNVWPEQCTERFTDDVLLHKARDARNSEKFTRLYDDADISGYLSESEACLALCSLLAFWAGESGHEQVLRLLESSALCREKMGHKRKLSTWGRDTVIKAYHERPESDYAPIDDNPSTPLTPSGVRERWPEPLGRAAYHGLIVYSDESEH